MGLQQESCCVSQIRGKTGIRKPASKQILHQAMDCLGHQERENRRNKILNLAKSPKETPDENLRVSVRGRSGPRSWSLKELEVDFETKPEWKRIEDEGGVLSIPVEELRMQNPPKPDSSGKVTFKEVKRGGGKQIENYVVGQTVENMNKSILEKHEEERKKAKNAGKSESQASGIASKAATKLSLFTAVNAWLDSVAEIKLKKAIERMMVGLKIPALLIRSIDLKQISALKNLGLKWSGEGEIDLMLAYVSGDFLHIVVYEVKRSQTLPWQNEAKPPNKQAVNKAETQLYKDVEFLMAILAGISPDQVKFHTVACFPDTPLAELEKIMCKDCLENQVICQEDCPEDGDDILSSLREKSKVPEKPDPASANGKQHLLSLSTRFLSHQSLLHNGYREVADQEKLATSRLAFTTQTVDEKMKQNEFVVASPQQQQAIDSFTASSSQSCFLMTGAAGTGKTLVASQVVNNLIQSLEAIAEPGKGPVLLVTAEWVFNKEDPLLKHLDANTSQAKTKIFNVWRKILKEYGVSESEEKMHLL